VSTIDVIIPCYNYGRFLPASVGSVLDQPDCSVRVLIIDDASPDGSIEIARDIAARDGRVQIIGHTRNHGHIATYNEGIAWSTATYMLLLSADDLASRGALSRAISLMDAHPKVGLVYGRFLRFAGGKVPRPSDLSRLPCVTVTGGRAFIEKLCSDPTNPVETATAVIRTSVQKQVGGYKPELPHAGDFEMWLRCAAVGDVGFVNEIQAFVRMHEGNMRNAYLADQMIGDFRQRHEAFREFFRDAANLPGAADLALLADRSLAEQVVWAAGRAFEDGEADDGLRDLARTIYPPITRTKMWWKQSAKRLIGSRGWRTIAPSVNWVRNALANERR
jgi:glycosyltransferase involved in cell wall biosynthesis